MNPATRPAVSVVVLAEGHLDDAGRCLAALEQSVVPIEEVVVVDASPQGAAPAPSRTGWRRLRAEPAAGRGAALATGAAAATGRVLIFLHADAQVEPGWLAPLLAEADGADPAIAGSRLVGSDGVAQDGLLLVYARPFPLSVVAQSDTSAVAGHRAPLAVPAVSSVALAIRADLLTRLGGLDPTFTAGGEDVDLCLRAGEVGVRVVVARASRVRHHASCATPRPGQGGETLLGERWLGRVPLHDAGRIHGRSVSAAGQGRPAVTVVLPLLDSGRVAARCLEEILRALQQGDELIVADAGSRDGSRPLARMLVNEAPFERRHIDVPGGDLAAAARAGLAAARRPLAALLQPAEVIPDGLVDGLSRLLQESAALDLVAFPAPPAGLVAAGRREAMHQLGAVAPKAFFATDTRDLEAAAMASGLRLTVLG